MEAGFESSGGGAGIGAAGGSVWGVGGSAGLLREVRHGDASAIDFSLLPDAASVAAALGRAIARCPAAVVALGRGGRGAAGVRGVGGAAGPPALARANYVGQTHGSAAGERTRTACGKSLLGLRFAFGSAGGSSRA